MATMDMNSKAMETFVKKGEKYALIGLDVKMEGEFGCRHSAPALWAFVDSLAKPRMFAQALGANLRAAGCKG